MATNSFLLRLAAATTCLATAPCWAQTSTVQLDPVTVSGRSVPAASVAGWGDVPLSKTPLQASVFGNEQFKDNGAHRLADLIGLDPALGDAYNAQGYWDFLSVRGFVLDNRFNFRRDGLPISAETSIPLENKARVEVLKGTSGMQAGTSAPGGLVNYVVKQPTDTPLRSAALQWRQAGGVIGSVDLSQRFGEGDAFGARLNVAAARVDPRTRSARGERHLLAAAGDWRISSDTLLEAEIETSHQSQPSVPGFSLLGGSVPSPADPRINLNNQPWSLPVVFDANTASLRLQQRLGTDWRFAAHLATQRLKTDDRVAFPFGCTAADGTYYADRFCGDGSFDMYDFRSENERRRIDAIDLSLQGKLQTGQWRHALTTGVLHSKVRNRFQPQAFNFAGTGNIAGTGVAPPAPTPTAESTNRDERSTELYLRDAVAIDERLSAWLGLRQTRLSRASVLTDGDSATRYTQSFTTPWLAASYAFAPEQMVYASWGRGVESEVAPNLSSYTNRGVALPALKSRQVEIGVKGSSESLDWSLTWFDIVRPQFGDAPACTPAVDSCTRALDGAARHRGVEAAGGVHAGPWSMRGGMQWLHARREGSRTAATNGLQPTNVPSLTLKLQAAYVIASLPGLSLQGNLTHEGSRMALPDNSASIPGYTRVDAAARWDTRRDLSTWTWRIGVDNLFDKRAWKESPYQFSHAYLFPLAPRTLRVSAQVDL